jgi:lysophospholipase L1-like esterase
MITPLQITCCALLTTLILTGTHLKADDPKPLMDSLVFSGRWDLRAPDRAITVNSGSYVHAAFSGTSLNAKFDTAANKAPMPTIAWQIDGGDWQEAEIAPDVSLASGLTDGSHTVWLMIRGIDENQSRWTQPLIGSVTFLGFTLSATGKMLPPLDAWKNPKLKVEFLGDSITEGVLVQAGGKGPDKATWSWQTDATHSYACLTAIALSADWRQVGFGATGLAHGGSGGAKGALDSFDYFYADCPRDDWQPDLVVINQGTNDGGMPPDKYEPLYAQYLALIRKAYPKAKIAALEPFAGSQGASIKKAVDEAKAQGDLAVYYIDSTGWYKEHALHPNAASSVGLADHLASALKTQVLGQ